MIVLNDIEQGSAEWKQVRLGKATASNFKKILAKGKGITRRKYMIELVAQRLSGIIPEPYTNASMQWGIETEPEARREHELRTGYEVKQVGFVKHDDDIGCSPDGLIHQNGMAEYKCPETTTFLFSCFDRLIINAAGHIMLLIARLRQ